VKNYNFKFPLLTVLLLIPLTGYSQNYQIGTRSENIIIKKDTSFIRHVTVSLKRSNDIVICPIVYDKELEELSDIGVYLRKGKRFKPEKNPVIMDDDIYIEYVSSKKVKYIVIPPDAEAEIMYTVKCSELMYFSNLPLFSHVDADTMRYQITVPESFHFSYDILHPSLLDYLVIDSLKSDSMNKWSIEVVPTKVEPDPLMLFGIYKKIEAPIIRTIVVPAAYKNREREYLNDWYLGNVETRRRLNSVTTDKIDELTGGLTDPGTIMNILYNYVRSNFKYVAIEIGMGAFIPTNANDVFSNKQGDCKDLSNFLAEALNYKGVKSDIALAATFDHISDCDFPSLSSANHVICVAYINDEPVILDPTDPVHLPETPVQSLQNRSILIINHNGGEFYMVNALAPQENAISYEIELRSDPEQMILEGEFTADYRGLSGNFLRSMFLGDGEDEMKTYGKLHYESVFGNQIVSDLNVTTHAKSVGVNGKLSIRGKIINDGEQRFLFFDFLPSVIETANRETLLDGTYLGHTIEKNVKLRILMDKPFESFNPIEQTYSDKGVTLNLRIANSSDLTIECDYEFVFDYFFINRENIDITNEILKSFKKVTNEPVILKNKI
jgi:hypothetical protein